MHHFGGKKRFLRKIVLLELIFYIKMTILTQK